MISCVFLPIVLFLRNRSDGDWWVISWPYKPTMTYPDDRLLLVLLCGEEGDTPPPQATPEAT